MLCSEPRLQRHSNFYRNRPMFEKIIRLIRDFFQSHGKAIIRNSPLLQRLYTLYRLVKRKLLEFFIRRFLPIVLTVAVVVVCIGIFLPHLIFSDRCYLMSVTNLTVTNTTASRPCVHGALLAFATDRKSLYFSAKITS